MLFRSALISATAFCGLCTGCASNIKVNGNTPAPDAVASADEAGASASHKVILSPGWYVSGGTQTNNAVGGTDVTAADGGTYFVDNAYVCNLAAGETLPEATTTRSGMTFVGWRYASEGEIITVAKMPDVTKLDSDLYLYAEWATSGAISPDPGPNPDPGPDPGPIDPVDSNYMSVGSQKYTLTRNTGNTTREEYWLGGSKAELTVGDTISLYMNGQKISAYIERNSSGIDLGDESREYDTFNVNLAGSFAVYLHKNESNWSVQFVVTTAVSETTVSIPANAVKSEITFKNGSVTVYMKNGDNFATSFSGYKLYMWDGDTKYFGEWDDVPTMSATMSAAQYDLTADVCFILRKDSGQTRDLSGMEVGGTYLITFVSGVGDVQKIKVA